MRGQSDKTTQQNGQGPFHSIPLHSTKLHANRSTQTDHTLGTSPPRVHEPIHQQDKATPRGVMDSEKERQTGQYSRIVKQENSRIDRE